MMEDMMTNETSSGESSGEYVEFETIQDLCNVLGMMFDACSCDNEDIRNITKDFGMDDLCDSISNTPHVISYELAYEPEYSRPLAAIIVLNTLFGILGNVLVVAIAIKNWKISIPYQKLIGQLGASDLLFAVLHLLSMIHVFWTNRWIYGETLCKMMIGSISLGSHLAVGLILIISVERYLAIVHPFFWKYGTKKLNYSLVAFNVCVGKLN